MPRTSRLARNARRTLVKINGEFHMRDEYDTYLAGNNCPYCHHPFASASHRDRHIMAKPECRTRHMHDLPKKRRERREREYKIAGPSSRPHPSGAAVPSTRGASGAGLRYNDPRRWTDDGRACQSSYIEHFPVSTAGQPISNERTYPVDLKTYLKSCGNLASLQHMEAAELLMTTGLSGGARTRHLQSSFYKGKTPWRDNRAMLKDIDMLVHGPTWHTEEFVVGEGAFRRVHTVYRRNPVDVIRDLIGNPSFDGEMCYAPQRHWTSKARTSRVYGEMWTGNWWWRRQLFLRDRHGTIVPVIIASDKTTMTKLSGNQTAYPVYLTIGNISKAVRRKTTRRATILIGYLPVDEFKDVRPKSKQRKMKGELVHRAMHSVIRPLEDAGRRGVDMWCADGALRRVYPLLAAFVGDWPEQCDMGCIVRSACPKCTKHKHGRGDEETAPLRTRVGTLQALNRFQVTGNKKALARAGLHAWWPWWADLPGAEFARCITPDLLHQLNKGLLKRHAMRWMQLKIGEKVVDERYRSMTRARNLRHFKRGISVVQQWTGRETKEMVKTLLPLIADDPKIPSDLAAFVRALIDFAYIAHSARMTDGELEGLCEAHAEMHRLKPVLVSSNIYASLEHFDHMPKFHMISHYGDSIRELGTPDGYNTEHPEYLHIQYVKRPWDASNKRDATRQIIEYCQRLEALRIHRAHLDEYYGWPERPVAKSAVLVADDEADAEYEGPTDRAGEDGDDIFAEEAEGDDGDEGAGDEDRRWGVAIAEADGLAHPEPEFAIAIRPLKRVTMSRLMTEYGATSLESALRLFLRPFAHSHYYLLPHDDYDVWHKLSLYHLPLSFAPDEPDQRDVIRICPRSRDAHGDLSGEAVFDTVLFLHDARKFGLSRYRAGRLRAIFRLPPRLQYLYSGELAYLELFTPFNSDPSPDHRLHTTSHARNGNQRRCKVIPLEDIKLACHLAPQFQRLGRDAPLDPRDDLLESARHFYFNHYYNHFTFLLMDYWRHHRQISD